MFTRTTSESAVTFRALLVEFAHRIGYQHIPVRPGAKDIHEFIGADAVHHELVTGVVRQIYRANRCGHLDAEVSARPTFAILGQTRAQLSRCHESDIDQVNLLDALGWAAREIFTNLEYRPSTLADDTLEKPASVYRLYAGPTP